MKINKSECINEDGHEYKYISGSSDSRDEWSEESYKCSHCNLIKTVRVYYDENGPYSRDIYYENG